MNDKITVLLIDDHKLIAEAWTMVLNYDGRFRVSGRASNTEEALELVKQLGPRVAIVDINRSPTDGFAITKKIVELSNVTKVIGISLYNNSSYVKKMMKAGAKGYVTKNSSKEELMNAIVEVDKGNKYICKEVKDMLALELEANSFSNRPDKLTVSELTIISYVRKGLSSREIASKLDLSLKTVEVHRYNILKKLDLKNTAALISYINEKGIH